MGTICPKCGKLNDDAKDEICPHCGVLYAKARQAQKQQLRQDAQREEEIEEVRELWAFLVRHPVIGISMVLAILAGGVAMFSYESGSYVADQRAMTGEAERACENHIRTVAQRPSTVRFHVSAAGPGTRLRIGGDQPCVFC